MLVINGVNSETNSHDDGTRAHATGRLAMDYPNLSELFASAQGKRLADAAGSTPAAMSTSAGLVAGHADAGRQLVPHAARAERRRRHATTS